MSPLREEEEQEWQELQHLRELETKYLNAQTHEERKEIWDALNDEEEEYLQMLGHAGPLDAVSADNWSPIGEDHPRFKAKSIAAWDRLEEGRRRIRENELFVSPTLAARIEALYEEAGGQAAGLLIDPDTDLPNEDQAIAAQKAAHLLDQAEAQQREAMPPVGKTRVQYTDKEAVEYMGTVAKEEIAGVRPWGDKPTEVTRTQLASWPADTIARFQQEHPAIYEEVLQHGMHPTAHPHHSSP